jgi:hypothetical protein
VFLSCDGNEVSALKKFQQLKGNEERDIRSRFDYWIGGGIHDKYFHGWPNDMEHKDCYVFKWRKGRQCHRFYSFLYHPTPLSNPGLQLCVLVSHAVKNEWNTDPRELDGAKRLRGTPAVIAAIKKEFPDKEERR